MNLLKLDTAKHEKNIYTIYINYLKLCTHRVHRSDSGKNNNIYAFFYYRGTSVSRKITFI